MAKKDGAVFPVPKFHFEVDIDGNVISFQEVSGLEQENQFLEYRNGDSELYVTQKRLGMTKTSTISMKKGIFKDDAETLSIYKDQVTDMKGSNDKYWTNAEGIPITITLMDEKGEPMAKYVIERAYPIKYVSTDLKSDANEVAIESIDFVHEGIEFTIP